MNVPLLDLKVQFQPLRTEIMAEVLAVCEEQGFILGPRLVAFEESVAREKISRMDRVSVSRSSAVARSCVEAARKFTVSDNGLSGREMRLRSFTLILMPAYAVKC